MPYRRGTTAISSIYTFFWVQTFKPVYYYVFLLNVYCHFVIIICFMKFKLTVKKADPDCIREECFASQWYLLWKYHVITTRLWKLQRHHFDQVEITSQIYMERNWLYAINLVLYLWILKLFDILIQLLKGITLKGIWSSH